MVFKKTAFTMIELIFAIVIIAISVVSLPMMTQVTSKNIEFGILQEAIFAAAATLNEATTYYWDEYSLNDANGYSGVINTDSGGCIAGTPNKRVGHVSRQCLDDMATRPYIGTNFNKSINVTAHAATPLFTADASAATYKDEYNSNVTVNNCATTEACIQFGLEANNPNLKEITMSITSSSSNTPIILLRTYNANIGEVKLASRFF